MDTTLFRSSLRVTQFRITTPFCLIIVSIVCTWNWERFYRLCCGFIEMLVICLSILLLVVDGRERNQITFQLNDLAKQLTGKGNHLYQNSTTHLDIVCQQEGQVISLLEATNGTFNSPCFQCVCRVCHYCATSTLCSHIKTDPVFIAFQPVKMTISAQLSCTVKHVNSRTVISSAHDCLVHRSSLIVRWLCRR